MPRSVKKYVEYCRTACALLIVLIVLVITYYFGREQGRRIAFAETNRAYYEHRGGRDLVDKYAFPSPFLQKYIEKHGLVTREEIDGIIQGYVRTSSRKESDGAIMDTYVFYKGYLLESYIDVYYDANERFLGFEDD